MKSKYRTPTEREERLVGQVKVRPLRAEERPRFMRLLARRHYLGSVQPVGEQMLYVAVSATGGWVALLVFAAAAKHLKVRELWIGWTPAQKRKRLSLIANNVRYLILPRWNIPNMGSRVLRLTTDRISADWQKQYGHPLVVLETFVNPEHFQGTVYLAHGWVELGVTSGYGRCPRDYYVRHNKPKRLFVKPLYKNAARSLQAEHLKPALAMVESKVRPRCDLRSKELRPLVGHFRAVPDFRQRFESYPLYSLLAIVGCAHFAGAPRGPCDLAAFAADLSQPQRRALGIRRNRQRRYPAPSAATFCRVLQEVGALKVEETILAYQSQIRGPAPSTGVVALDGKEPKHSGGQHIVSAVNVPDLYYLGSEMVDTKTNEIPVARTLMSRLDLEGRLVGLDALHTQQETSREIVQEAGGDYLLTVKKNQPGIRKTLAKALADIPASFPPRPITPTHAWTEEINRGRHEQRMLDSRPYSAEQACFPAVSQIAKVFRKTSGRKPETVYVVSSREPSAMIAEQWMAALRQYWGIENGVHQRVDASANEDRSRVRTVNSVWVMGMFRRLAVSIYAEWRSRSKNRCRASLHDFHNLMARHNKKQAYSLVSAVSPSLNRRIMK